MDLDQYVEKLKSALAAQLRSVVLYGSAAAGDFVPKRSDYNLLLILTALGMSELKRLASLTQPWIKAGNPPPLCFTAEQLARSTDVFPIELLDLKENHKVLFGPNPMEGLTISKANLRHQLEYELKSKLMGLRKQYLAASGDTKVVHTLLVQSLASFLVLFRAVLRLEENAVPASKMEALQALSGRFGFSPEIFTTIHGLKSGQPGGTAVEVEGLFGRYLREIEVVIEKVDRQLQSGNA